jgi:hypothetical protein
LLRQRPRKSFQSVRVVFRIGQTDDESVVGILGIDLDIQANVPDATHVQAHYSLAFLENGPAGFCRAAINRETVIVATVIPRSASKRIGRRSIVLLVDPALASERAEHDRLAWQGLMVSCTAGSFLTHRQ